MRAKNEVLRLTTAYSYEDIGKAFVEASRDLKTSNPDDFIKAVFLDQVSFKITMMLLERVREAKPPEETTLQLILRKMGL